MSDHDPRQEDERDDGSGRGVLIVVDMVEDMFVDNDLTAERQRLTSCINDLVSFARARDYPVVWVRQEYSPDLSDAPREYKLKRIQRTIRGTKGAQFLAELAIDPRDLVVIKPRYSPFFGTALGEQLEAWNPGMVIVAGVNTHACVRMTAIDAYQRDYEVFVISDCVGSYDRNHHNVSLRYIDGKIGTVLSREEFADTRGAERGGRRAI